MTVENIKAVIASLPADDFARLAAWFAELDAQRWDRQIEADQRSGRLDAAINRARKDIAAGLSRPL